MENCGQSKGKVGVGKDEAYGEVNLDCQKDVSEEDNLNFWVVMSGEENLDT